MFERELEDNELDEEERAFIKGNKGNFNAPKVNDEIRNDADAHVWEQRKVYQYKEDNDTDSENEESMF